MVKIKRQIVPNHIGKKVTYSGTNSKKYIICHETANESIGANAQTHANLQSRGFSASWHYSVGSDGIYQSFEDNAQCWHAGSPSYNKQSIGIEICVNADGNYKKAVDNAIELTKHLMKKHNISVMNVLPHQKTSTWSKECPRYLLRGRYITWNEFINRLKGDSNVSVSKTTNTKPKKNNAPKEGSIVDYLNAKGINSSFANRKKLAAKHGISNYKGTASQNTTLLSKLKSGSKPTSKPKVTGSVVDYLKSKKIDSSFANRKKLAAKHGIKNYQGTESQNVALLNKLQGSTPKPSKPKTSYKVGSTVTLKNTASKFATGQSILDSAKGKRYKIIQTKSDRVLLDKIMSWVKKSDVQ